MGGWAMLVDYSWVALSGFSQGLGGWKGETSFRSNIKRQFVEAPAMGICRIYALNKCLMHLHTSAQNQLLVMFFLFFVFFWFLISAGFWIGLGLPPPTAPACSAGRHADSFEGSIRIHPVTVHLQRHRRSLGSPGRSWSSIGLLFIRWQSRSRPADKQPRIWPLVKLTKELQGQPRASWGLFCF